MNEQAIKPIPIERKPTANNFDRLLRRVTFPVLTSIQIVLTSCTPTQNSPDRVAPPPLATAIPTADPKDLAGNQCWYRHTKNGTELPDGVTDFKGDCPTPHPNWEEIPAP